MNRISAQLVGILALAGGVVGCGIGDEPQFQPGEVDDDVGTDDDSTPGDDDSLPQNQPPLVTITSLEPEGGSFIIGFDVSDPDGDLVDVSFEFALCPTDWSDPLPPTLSDGLEDLVGGSYQTTWSFASDIAVADGEFSLRARGNDSVQDSDWSYYPSDGSCYEFGNGVITGVGHFDEPGATEAINFDDSGDAIVPLSDGEIDSNVGMRFFMVLVNTSGAASGLSLEEIDGGDAAAARVAGSPAKRTSIKELKRWTETPPPPSHSATASCVDSLSLSDINHEIRDFTIRSGLDDTAREVHPGTLKALGDGLEQGVAIFVDDFVPIDHDEDCDDPDNEVEYDFRGADGFDNCDLAEAADVIAANILPNTTQTFGALSDVDQNCRVTVFISNQLNGYTVEDTEEDNDNSLVRSFSEAEIDLWASDPTLNPLSNEQEIVYVHAPDPSAIWNRNVPVDLDSYLNFELVGNVAAAVYKLISYANHMGIYDHPLDPNEPNETLPLDDWLDDGLALLAADLTGFGAIAYQSAWTYLDQSQAKPLLYDNAITEFNDRGGAWLFARYLYEQYGMAFIDATKATSDSIGAVESCTGGTMDETVMRWAVALAVSGRINDEGTQLVPESDTPNFKSPGVVVVTPPDEPPDPVVAGVLYGANGFQQGFMMRGVNRSYVGGTDLGGATEIESRRIKAENVDALKFMPTTDFYGSVEGGYGVVVIEISSLVSEITTLKVGSDGGLVGYVIRSTDDPDEDNPVLDLELVDGSLLTAAQPLSTLPSDGSEICIIGNIELDQPITVPDSADTGDDDSASGDDDDDDDSTPDETAEATIPDTDRYLLRLDEPGTQRIGIHMDIRYSGSDGSWSMNDPWFAVALAEDVPDHQALSLTCSAPLEDYPATTVSWIHQQYDLISDPTAADALFVPTVPSGEALTCSEDLDQDGVPDLEEPDPQTFAEQIRVMQASRLSQDDNLYDDLPPGYWPYPSTYIDVDSNELPANEFSSSDPRYNIGGMAVPDTEQAMLELNLPGDGREYIIVVGDGSAGTGPYDLCLRYLTEE